MIKMKHLLCILIALVFFSQPAEAKKDSAAMARKAQKELEKEAKKQAKEEQKRLEELERLATPHFEGGDIDKFEHWIVANLRRDFGPLPPDAPHIVVDVPFYVEADGRTTLTDEDTTDKRLHPRLVQEIERVILFSPTWEPGHDGFGNPIRSRQVASLTFKHDHSLPDPLVIHPTPRPVPPHPGPAPAPHPKPKPQPKPKPGGRHR